ncbi:MAG TPA: 4-hydroxy-tetrahydrodipicolinate reductase [Dehalococcoidia bacterium]|nr:4-hydroxy-tetrahydrodipicolinate reductase [Dehalococcoidia bacterium]
MTIRVVVSGTGKMGTEVVRALAAEPDMEPAGTLDRSMDPEAFFSQSSADVVVDFTGAERAPVVALAALAAGVRPVIGTSGLKPDFLSQLDEKCRELGLGAVVAPNFALGAVIMMHIATLAAPYFSHAEIIEMHHDQKVDAPSGTALATAEAMAKRRKRPFQRNQPQRETLPGSRSAALEGVTIHSVRLPGLVAHQEVLFGAPGQALTIRHDSLSRESFMPGVIAAIHWVMDSMELTIGLEKVLGLE